MDFMTNEGNWKEKLDMADKAHLWDQEIYTYSDLKKTIKLQRSQRTPDFEPCWDCRFIARKLGLKE